ncbi:hypothetical protein B4589_004850 [Halolamina sp. CBA1230]|uniref:hypothetical protein n=1 Tax=Halolamina sp. CBA1230 TaxID=1853690 RepID=UPI0009A17453|nr:hypothetical protein [Halolamina sp. CBA1230]QKY19741.1 hypothetical protein B4589_004850 [Halolamina sp. CBA1230]
MAGEDGDDTDWEMAPEGEGSFPEDAAKRETLRAVADEIRARDDSSEASQIGAFLYRVSDLYKEGEETSIPEIYMNMRHILEVREQGGLDPEE